MLESKVSNLFEGELSLGCCLNPGQLHHYTIRKHRECVWDCGFQCVENWANPLISKSPFWGREHHWEKNQGAITDPCHWSLIHFECL